MLSGRNIEDQVAQLRSPNNKKAYRALKSLIDASKRSDEAYRHIDTFIEMMRDPSSCVRRMTQDGDNVTKHTEPSPVLGSPSSPSRCPRAIARRTAGRHTSGTARSSSQ